MPVAECISVAQDAKTVLDSNQRTLCNAAEYLRMKGEDDMAEACETQAFASVQLIQRIEDAT